MADKKAPARSIKEIESELAQRRQRLAGTVDELVVRTSPVEIKRRAVETLKSTADTKKTQLVGTVNEKTRTEEGEIDLRLLATALGALGGLILTLGVARRLFHK